MAMLEKLDSQHQFGINIIYSVNTNDPCFILSWSDTTALSHSQILSVKDWDLFHLKIRRIFLALWNLLF